MGQQFSFMETESGEYIGVSAIEITAIPFIQTLNDNGNISNMDVETAVCAEFRNMLSEVYQCYRSMTTVNQAAELSLDLLWITEPVFHQPYRAKIRLFLLIRSIDTSEHQVKQNINRVLSICKTGLRTKRYSFGENALGAVQSALEKVSTKAARAIVKEERFSTMQSSLLAQCYAFDRFSTNAPDMGTIVNSLIECPNVAISISLIPTHFSSEERATVAQLSQVLDTMSKGIMTPGIGNVSITAAESVASVYKYYQENSTNPLFSYGILVYGDSDATGQIASKVYGYLTYDALNAPALKMISLPIEHLQPKRNFYAFPWIANELLIQTGRNSEIRDYSEKFLNVYRLPYVITSTEASTIFRLPIGTQSLSAGLTVNYSDNTSKTYSSGLINSGDIEIGILKASPNGDRIGISLNDLTKHMLIVGTPGSGKTTFSIGLLDRLWKQYQIPFLVIEPAKNEYRALIQSIPDIQIFTPGKNYISPFVFNPFVPPRNVRLETYKSTLKTAFAAAVSMTTPLDKIFEESINNCYADHRWLDNYTTDDKGLIFNITEFIKCFQKTFDKIGYTGETRNIGRAGTVRLKSLVNLFDNYYSIPIEDLLQKPTIIELAAIENSDEKALIISLLLLSILSYVNANYIGDGTLKNIILLEEAHVLLDAETNTGDARPAAIAQELLKRMLAEIRAYGVGLMVADQSPRKVTADVIALTDMKMVFRIVEGTDRQLISDSMNMADAQSNRLSRLKPGEAFLFFNRLDEPEEIITPNYRLENNISISLSDDTVRGLCAYWKENQKALRPYPECDLISCCREMCDYDRRILAREIARRIFEKNFTSSTTRFEPVFNVFKHIRPIIKAELNDEPFSPELFSCVKCHLWRRIKYETLIPVKEIQIINSLKKM